MKLIWNIVHFALAALVLISSMGVPVIINQSSAHFSKSIHFDKNYDSCTETLTSCCTKSSSNTTKNGIQSFVLCKPVAESCCCIEETEFVFFQFDVPICLPQLAPHFVQAYSSDLNSGVALQRTIQCTLLNNHLPPPKTFSQQLSVFQVFRL